MLLATPSHSLYWKHRSDLEVQTLHLSHGTPKGEMKVKIFPKWEGIARKAFATLKGLGVHVQLEERWRPYPAPPPWPTCKPTSFCKNHVILRAYRRLMWVFSDKQVGKRNFPQQWSWINSIDIDRHGRELKLLFIPPSQKAACDPQIIVKLQK